MRALFYVGDRQWSGCARAFLAAARGLGARGHQATVVAPGGSVALRRAEALGVDSVAADPDATAAGDVWWLRRVLQERFIETVFVHTDREQLIVSSAMRLAERGAVIRRVPSFSSSPPGGGRFAQRIAATGLVVSTDAELAALANLPRAGGLRIPAAVAPLGVNVAEYDAIAPAHRSAIGVPVDSLLIACAYEAGARFRLATAMRTLALLRPRHPDMHLAVIGPGARDEDLRMHAAALDVADAVSFHASGADDLALLRAADVGWVVAGGDEGAYAFLDCMAMRIPVLAERSPMPQHYVADGITGVLLSPGAPSHTAAAVAAFLVHADRRAAMGNAGRTRVQRDFDERAMIDGFERALAAGGDRTRWAVR